MLKNGLKIGDQVFIKDKNHTLSFVVTDFVRDMAGKVEKKVKTLKFFFLKMMLLSWIRY